MSHLSLAWHAIVSGFLLAFTVCLVWLIAHVAALPASYPATVPYPTPLPTATPWQEFSEHCTYSNMAFPSGDSETVDVRCRNYPGPLRGLDKADKLRE